VVKSNAIMVYTLDLYFHVEMFAYDFSYLTLDLSWLIVKLC